MRRVNANAQALRDSLNTIFEVPCVRVQAKNRDTSAIHTIGFWRGIYAETFNVTSMFNGATTQETFYPGLLELGEVTHESGLNVRVTQAALTSIPVKVLEAFRLYDTAGAKIEGWLRCYNPETMTPVGVDPWFCGYVDVNDFITPPAGESGRLDVEIVSMARTLTIASTAVRSDEYQRRRMGDRILRYKGTTKDWDIPWGGEDR
jgi:hypothetical protein